MSNNFRKDLEFSLNSRYEDFWDAIYRKAFPNLKKTVICDNPHYQKMGIDRFVHLTNTRIFGIDEKVRRKDYGDILLEYISNDQKNTPGWIMKDLSIDFLAYGCIETRRAYLFSWPMLRRVWAKFGDRWINKGKLGVEGFKQIIAENEDDNGQHIYNTISVAVPYRVLRTKLNQVRIIQL